jgi:hypothetical protein
MMDKPIFQHDCETCTFLGSFQGSDLYCHESDLPTIIARYGDDGPEYISGFSFAARDPRLAEAKRRAVEQGLIGVE